MVCEYPPNEYLWHIITKSFVFVASTAPFRVEFLSDGIELMEITTTIADIASKGVKLAYWQNSC